jgi:hypothetical protein
VIYNSGRDVWAKEFRERRLGVSTETIERYLFNLQRTRLTSYIASRASSCAIARRRCSCCRTTLRRTRTRRPSTSHPRRRMSRSRSIPGGHGELKARTINQVRTFLKAHPPMTAAVRRTRGSPRGCLELSFVADPTCVLAFARLCGCDFVVRTDCAAVRSRVAEARRKCSRKRF